MVVTSHIATTRTDDVERSRRETYKEAVSILNSLGLTITYLVRNSKPSEIIIPGKKFSKIDVNSLKIVKTYSGYLIDFSCDYNAVELPHKHIRSDLYAIRNFYTYKIDFTKVRGEIAVGHRRMKNYIVLNGAVIDEYPPQSLRGWIIVASLLGEDDQIPSIVETSIPYDDVFRKLVESSTPKALLIDRVLGHITTYRLPTYSITALNLDNLYTGKHERLEHVVLSIGGMNLLDPNNEALKMVNIDFSEVKKDLLKVIIGAVMFFINKKMKDEEDN